MESISQQNQGLNEPPDFGLNVHPFSVEEIPKTTSLLTDEQIDESWLLQESQWILSSKDDNGGRLGDFENIYPEKSPVLFDAGEAFPLNQQPSSVDLLTGLDIETHNQLAYVKQLALNQIVTFSQDSNLREKLKTAFGDKGKTEDGLNLIKNIQIPDITLIPLEQLQAKGGFDGKTIYLAIELLLTETTEAINVLIEEIGHYIDQQLNHSDSPGDEGAIFAHLVQNRRLTDETYQQYLAEDDHATRIIEGKRITLELSSLAGTPEIISTNDIGEVLQIPDIGQTTTPILFQWTYSEAEYNSEVGFYLVDEQGRVNGIAPEDPNYVSTVLSASQTTTLFSPNQLPGNWQQLQIPWGYNIAFYLIVDSTRNQWLNTENPENRPNAFFSVNGANSDDFDHSQAQNIGTGIWKLAWEDLINGGDQDFNDVVLTISQPGLIAPGEARQKVPLDINWVSGDREANVEMGFFFVDNPLGQIGDLLPGDPGYALAALNSPQRQTLFRKGIRDDRVTLELSSGQYIGWYLISGGTVEQWLTSNPQNLSDGPVALFSYPQANRDGLSHLHYQTPYELGWETSVGGGDRDYDDLVFRFAFGTPLAVENEPIESAEEPEGEGEAEEAETPVTDPPTPITDPSTDPPNPSLSINDVSLIEGDNGITNAIFTVSLSQPSLNQVSVNYRTEALTAIEDEDYQPISGQLTFAPSETTKTLTIAINGDELEELDENFTLVLSEPVNAVLQDDLGIATIINDDQPPEDEDDETEDPNPIPDIVLREEENYLTTHQQNITIPSTPSLLTFTYSQLNFDTTDPNRINDGFEVALLDNQGNSIVHTIGESQDAFFNITEGNSPKYGQSVSIDGQTVTLDLSSIIGDTSATLVFRLINNDTDSTTTVTVTDIAVVESNLNNTNPLANTPLNPSSSTTIDFEKLENISNSIQPYYGRTSVNEDTQVLYTDLTLENLSNYPIKKQLIVAVTNLSDPNVSVVGIDGKTPDGLPYFDFSHLIHEGSLNPNQTTKAKTISFYNPDKIQFTYDLVILGQLNKAPVWVSEPEREIKVNYSYNYQLQATDTDGDSLTYKLLASPQGLILDEINQTLIWTPNEEQIGNHNIILEVKDGQGGSSQQSYTLGVFKDIPNRPPLITSTPEVDGFVNTNYRYQVIANDIDGDNLSYHLISSDNGSTLPDGMTINETSGLIEWTPNVNQIGQHDFLVEVRDGSGNSTQQSVQLNIKEESNNNAPVIISSAITEFYLDLDNYHYLYDVNALDPDKDLLTYTLVESPSEMTIDSNSGQINWQPTAQQIGTHQITVEVIDGRGGIDSQTFVLEVLDIEGGVIQGTVWDDLNKNGFRDTEFVQGDNPEIIFVLDISGSTGLSFSGTAVGDINQDGRFNTILDAELASLLALNNQLIELGLGSRAKISVVVFESTAKSVDMDLNAPGEQLITTPSADNNNNGIIDLEEIVTSINIRGGTNFKVALDRAIDVFEALETESGNGNLLFFSDGSASNNFEDEVTRLTELGVNLSAFGVGNGASLNLLEKIDPNVQRYTSTDELLDIFNNLKGDVEQFLEPGLEGVTVYLDLNNNGYLDFEEPQYISRIDDPDTLDIDETGQYEFTGLAPGTYTVGIVVPSNREQTYPNTPSRFKVSVFEGDTINKHFGTVSTDIPPLNIDPTITSDVPDELMVGQTLSHLITAIDENNDPLTFTLPLSPDGMVIDESTGRLIWTPLTTQIGTHDVIVKVSDGQGGFDLQGFTIVVASENTAPVITSTPVTTAGSNSPYQYQIQAQDDQTEGLTFILDNAPDGMSIDGTTGLLTWQPTENQFRTHNVTVRVEDELGANTTQNFTIKVISNRQNDAPILTTTPGGQIKLGRPYLYQIKAHDPNGDPLTYTLETAPEGMNISDDGLIHWTPTPTQLGEHKVILHIADGQGAITQLDFTLAVVSQNQNQNQNPLIDTTPNSFNATVGQTYEYNPTASDPDGHQLQWQLINAPDGMSVNPESGTLRWIPTDKQLGSHDVELQVMDSYGAFRTQTFTLTVRGVNVAPTVTSHANPVAQVDQLYQYQITASDTEGQSLTYLLQNSPDGLIINPQTGLIQWIPQNTQQGNHTLTVVIEDDDGATTTQTFTLTVEPPSTTEIEVSPPGLNQPPAITSKPVFTGTIGNPYTYTVTASDPNGDTITFRLIKAPQGMTLDPNTGQIQWTNPQLGNHTVAVAAIDSQGTGGVQEFTLNIIPNTAPIIQSTPVLSASPGQPYGYDLRATDSNADANRYHLITAPLGMTIDELGRVRWTPNAENTGNNPVEIAVTDSRGATVTQSYNLTVTVDNIAPTVRVNPSIQPVNLGQSVTLYVRATDNIGVSTLSLTVNGQAVTLDGNGLYTFTPTEVGTIEAVATAIDPSGNTNSVTSTFEVLDFSDEDAPIINLPAFSEDTVTSPTEIIGTVNDDNLQYYTLEVAKLGSDDFQEVFRGTNEVNNDVLGIFDPTLLENDAYSLRLKAVDAGGNIVFEQRTINVEGDLKLGNFQLSFTDLSIPVSGIPISITRTYDTLTAQERDDFGYGWRLEFRDTNLRTSLGPDDYYDTFDIIGKGFKEGDKVYLTLPGGKRETFTFKPELDLLGAFLAAAGGGLGIQEDTGLYHPKFVSESDSNNVLTVKDALLIRTGTGEFAGIPANLYNPVDPYFGRKYTLTTGEGIVYEIDALSGDLLTATDTNGNKLTFSESGIISDSGVEVKFLRDAKGRITSIVDPLGNIIQYEYDVNGDLIKVIDREENETKFDYHEQRDHYLETIIDPLNREAVRTEYDEDGRLKRIIDVDGDPTEFIYDPDNDIQITKDAFGNPTIHEYDQRGNVIRELNALGHETLLEYDDNNNVIKVIDANGNIIEYTYDSRGNVLSRTALHDPSNSNPEITRYTYNKYNQNTAVILPTGAIFNQNYDSRGNLLSLTDGEGNIIQAFTYDYYGNVTSESDPTGTSYYSDFDAFGNARTVKDSLGNIITSTYDNNGRIITMTDDEGISTFTYDKLGREIKADYGDGIYVEYGYEGAGSDWTVLDAPTIGHIERKFTEDGKLGGWVTPAGEDLTFTYDEAGRLKTEITPDSTTIYEYDALGRVTRVIDQETGFITQSHYDTLVGEDPDPGIADNLIGQLTGRTLIIDENTSYTTSYTYYADGKTKSMTDANGNTWFYEYTINTSTVIDPLGRRTTNVQTDQYLPSETIYADGTKTTVEYLYQNNLLEGSDYPTIVTDRGGRDRHFNYDESGRLISATDLGDTTYTYTYEDYGLASINSPTNETILSYSYDNEGNLQRANYADGGVKEFVYDENNQLSQVTLPTGVIITYEYNELGEEIRRTSTLEGEVLTQWNANKDLLRITDNTGTTTYDYDENTGQLEAIDYSNGQRIEYEYDPLGRTTLVTVKETATSEGYTTSYEYDSLGNLTKVTDPNGGETVMVYDGINRLTERTLPNGIKTTYSYQTNIDWIEKITHTSVEGEVLASIEYVREGTGEPVKIIREDGSYVELDYDESLRVIKESYYDTNGTLIDETEYSYDADGNRLEVSHGDAEGTYYYDNIHQLTEIMTETGSETYTYDEGGRIKSITRDGETWNLEYNSADLITKITNSNGEVLIEYEYDSNGRRIEAIDSEGERNYLVANLVGTDLESPHLITDENGEFVSGYVYSGSMPILRLDENGEPIYYLTDAMGSVIGLADGNGAEIAEFEYDSFGNLRNSQGNDLGLTGGDFRFQGQWLESNTDLYHFRARYYDPESGRFVSRDPVEIIEYEPESSNPYQFVYNNPHIYSDPSGEITLLEINTTIKAQDTLRASQQYVINQAKDYFVDQAKGVVGNLFQTALKPLLPNMWMTNILDKYIPSDQGDLLGSFIQDQVCGFMKQIIPLHDRMWLEAEVSTHGEPKSDGFGCDDPNGNFFIDNKHPNPDFIFKKGGPESTDYAKNKKYPKAWLIGDIKVSMGTLRTDVVNNKKQWQAIYNYANYDNQHQYTPLTFFIVWNNKGSVDGTQAELQKEALERGVLMYVLRIFD